MDWKLALAITVAVIATDSRAQEVPGNVQPGQIEQQFERPPEARVVADQIVLDVPTQQAPANAASLEITIGQIEIRGASVYTPTELMSSHADLIGARVPLTRIYELANAITARYRADGYVLSRAIVSEQQFQQDAANVRIDVVEGYVASVDYSGEYGGRRQLLDAMASRVTAERPHRQASLERLLLLLNDMAGAFASARGAYVPVPDQPGAFRVIVSLAQDRFALGLSQTNRGSELLGPEQTEVNIGLNSVLGLQEQTSLRYINAGGGELNLLAISQSHWLSAGGSRLTWSLSRTEATPDPDATNIPLNFESESISGSLTYSYPLRRTRRSNIELRLGASYHDGSTDSSFNGSLIGSTGDRIFAIRAGIRLDWIDALQGINLVDLEISQGMETLGASRKGDPSLSRLGGRPDFGKARIYVARVQQIGGPLSLLLAAEGQHTDDLLLSPEQFGIGGATFLRAYDASELVGDSGAAGKAELRLQFGSTSDSGHRGMLYAFYEGGFVRREEERFGQPRRESLTSAGGGIRFTLFGRLNGYVEGAVPVRQAVALEGNDDTRVFGGLSLQF